MASTALLRTLRARIRRTGNPLARRGALDLPHRIARQPRIRLADDFEVDARQLNRIRVTQQELAGMLGATREAVNKSVEDFAAAGWVDAGRGSVTLRDRAAIVRFL
jgi:CRP-like cAMP-binding protein